MGSSRLVLILLPMVASSPFAAAEMGGHALHFDGNDTVRIADSVDFDGLSRMTIEFWVKYDSQEDGQYIVDQFAGGPSPVGEWLVRTIGTKITFVYRWGGLTEIQSNASVTDGGWHHVAIVKIGNADFQFFIDGQLDKEVYTGHPIVLTADLPIRLGSRGSYEQFFQGTLDEIRLWNLARTVDEIAASWNRTVEPNSAGLLAYWRLDEAPSHPGVIDSSPGVHHGSLGETAIQGSDDPARVVSTAPIERITETCSSAEDCSDADGCTIDSCVAGICSHAQSADVPAWIQKSVVGPSPRVEAAMAFDAGRGVHVLFGGLDDGGADGETWEYDGREWRLRSQGGLTPRIYPAMVYDVSRHEVILFGGTEGSTDFGDTWAWNGMAWTLRSASGPSPRHRHALSYDVARGRTVLFGGRNQAGTRFADTWEWDGSTWTLRATTGATGRMDHAMCYDSRRSRTVLFGGSTGNMNDETWEWDGATWVRRFVTGPLARRDYGMVFDSNEGVTLLFGGITVAGILDRETWTWDGETWRLIASTGPSGRMDHAMAFDSWRAVSVVVGGSDALDLNGETWEFSSDCNRDGLSDRCQVAAGALADCNANLRPDACDVSEGSSIDIDWNNVPDECETGACCRVAGCSLTVPSFCPFVCDAAARLATSEGYMGCLADADGNGVVNSGDRGVISANIGESHPVLLCLYDLDGNGVINPGDRGIVSANIDQCLAFPDYQNGSGLNQGTPDVRFGAGTFLGTSTTCATASCP